jgi:arginase
MGAGPSRIVETLRVDAETILPASEWRAEIRTTFELYRQLAMRVAAYPDAVPIVLGGNCGCAIGAAAGVGTERLAVIWFDAHGDYNTPDASESGFLDGMSMAILTGHCWQHLALTIPNFKPVPPWRTMHVGARDYSSGERERMLADGVTMVAPHELEQVPSLLGNLEADRVLIHVDLDVIDPRYGRANQFAAPGGLSPEDVLGVIDAALARFELAALTFASYDPSCDEEGRIAAIAKQIVERVSARAPRC